MTDHKEYLKRVFGNSINQEQALLKKMLETAPSNAPPEVLRMLQERLDENDGTLGQIEATE